MMRASRWQTTAFALPLMLLSACTQGPRLRGQIAGLEKVLEQAERNGALRCAPRELATARSQLRFATLELDQGFVSKAESHLLRAEPNTHAALALSPPEHCAERVEAPDTDGDGYRDPVDQCPKEAENYNNYLDDDGCPDDPDTDRDGLLDSVDSCVLVREDRDAYLDEDGCPEVDNDLDGIADVSDKCPLEPESFNGREDEDGCPEPELAVVTDCEVKITQQIHFDFNKDRIRPESYPVLDAVVQVLDGNPEIKIEVQGHTDNVGTPRYNKDLSNRRAAAVRKYLVAHGIAPERLASIGHGLERPLVDNNTEENRALNRRVQFMRTEGSKEGCPPAGSQ